MRKLIIIAVVLGSMLSCTDNMDCECLKTEYHTKQVFDWTGGIPSNMHDVRTGVKSVEVVPCQDEKFSVSVQIVCD